jgi:UDP-3-O-[3-hydroxymyristoyl] N-acetylglucosamine deacetylase
LNSPSGRVYLVEHLLSAVYALGIDNLEIEIPDGVGPTTDNCAREYFDVLKVARVSQSAPKKYWRFAANSEVKVNGEDGKPDFLAVKPASRFVIGYSAYYPHRVIQNQRFRFEFSEEGYRDNVSEARPPGFLKNKIIIKILRFLNATEIYNGVNQTNYLWVSSKGAESCANPAGFGPRYGGDEFVRHKILDVIGTLALTGRHFKNTEFQFNMTGHRFDII